MVRSAFKQALRWTRYLVVWAAFACFAVRLAIPAGFMPAPLAEGGPIVICDGGFDGALLAHLGSARHATEAHDAAAGMHGMHHDGHGSTHDAWKYCPVGALFSSAALATSFALPLLSFDFERPELPQPVFRSVVRVSPYHSRAPPTTLSS